MNNIVKSATMVILVIFSNFAISSEISLSGIPSQTEGLRQNKENATQVIDALQWQQARPESSQQVQLNSVTAPKTGAPYVVLNKIEINNFGVKGAPDVKDIILRYKGVKIGREALLQLVKELTNRYVKSGFVTTLMRLDTSHSAQGKVVINVAWGRIGKITVNGHSPFSRNAALFNLALPITTGQILNIHDIDQLVDNLSTSLRTSNIHIQPSLLDGYSNLNIVTQTRPYLFSLQFDNYGSAQDINRGQWRISPTVVINGPLGNGDTIQFSGEAPYYDSIRNNHQFQYGGQWSIPWKRFRITFGGNYSEYLYQKHSRYSDYCLHGNSKSYNIKVSGVASRAKMNKINLFSQLKYYQSKNYWDDILLNISSQKYYEITAGSDATGAAFGGSVYGKISLSLLKQHIDTWHANAQVSWLKPIKINQFWGQYKASLGGQWANIPLPSSAQIVIGDHYTVRGFNSHSNAAGDEGVWMSNTLSTRFFSLIAEQLKWNAFIGADVGIVHRINSNVTPLHTLASGTVGVDMSWENSFSISASVSTPFYNSTASRTSPIWSVIGHVNF